MPSTTDRAPPSAHFGDPVVPVSSELRLDLAQLHLQPLPDRLRHHREPPVPLLPADVCPSPPPPVTFTT